MAKPHDVPPDAPPDAPPDKEDVRADWTARAPFWNRWADQLAEMADRFNQPMLDALGVAPGMHALDLASGAGEPALSLAGRVSATGHVTATDLVPEMLAGARRRAAALGLANMAFEHADMERLPFEDQRFDLVTCRFGLMFVPDPAKALAEARRVLKPGGRVGMLVWGPLDDTTIMRAIAAAARATFGPDSVRRHFDLPFRFGRAGALEALFAAAGLVDVAERELRFEPEAPADAPFWRPMLDMTMGARLAETSPDEIARLEDALREELRPHRAGSVYRLRVHVRLGIGAR